MHAPDENAADQHGAGALNGVLDDLGRLAEGRTTVAFGDIVSTLGARGFGPLLLILSLFLMVPVGAIPGVPAAVGLVVIGIGAQVARGRKGLWLPQRVNRLRIEGQRVTQAIAVLRPRLQWLGRVLHRRLPLLAEGRLSLMTIGLVLICLGIAMVIIGFVPLLPLLLALPALVFGIGLTMRDGVVVLLGHAGLIPAVIVAWRSLAGG
ncbi:exopolysaccharide biosynthesis protein [Roseicyclus elongatus]|nr:exopolysaccharide biosynthesis protein [Roseibacterium elongatum]